MTRCLGERVHGGKTITATRLWRCGAALGGAPARQGFEMGGDAIVGRERRRHLQSLVEEGGKVGVRGLWFKLG